MCVILKEFTYKGMCGDIYVYNFLEENLEINNYS